MGFFLWSTLFMTMPLILFLYRSMQPWLLQLYNKSWNWVNYFFPVSSSKIVLIILVLLPFCIHFRIILCVYLQKILLGFYRNCVKLYTNLERLDIFTIPSLPIHEYGMSPHLLDLWFLSLALYNFQFTNPVNVSLDLYLSIAFVLRYYKCNCILKFGVHVFIVNI